MNIALIGLKSCGKSTVGPLLAQALGYQCIDTDTLIENFYAKQHDQRLSFKQIHQTIGEFAFRELESKVLVDVLALIKDTVICTGGGSLLKPENIELLKKHCKLVHLNVSEQSLLTRWQASAPGFVDTHLLEQQLHDYFLARQPLMTSSADMTIDCDQNSPVEVANEINKQLSMDN